MRNPVPLKFENFQGVNVVDNNVVLPVTQVPYAYNTDFGRQVGAAGKRFGLESIIADTEDLVGDADCAANITLSPTTTIGQTWTTGEGVTNLSRILLKCSSTPSGITASVYTDATKTTLLGTTTNVSAYDSAYWKITFTPSFSISESTSYYVELTSSSGSFTISLVSCDDAYIGTLYAKGILQTSSLGLYMKTYCDLGAGGIVGRHCFQSTSGDIPMIAHGTNVYKLSGANTSKITDTEDEFNAGTLTDICVFPDIDAPTTAPTLTGDDDSGAITGEYYAKVTFVDASGVESECSPASAKYTATNAKLKWSNIPLGGTDVMQRKLYRTKAGGLTYYLVDTIDNNTDTVYDSVDDTVYDDTVSDDELTAEYVFKRVVLGVGNTKGTAAITQDDNVYSSTIYTGTTLGETFLVPAGVKKIYSISPYMAHWSDKSDSVTLTLYTSLAKTSTVGSATITGVHYEGNIDFVLNATVTPGAEYYYEITCVTNDFIRVQYGSSSTCYKNGKMYYNGVVKTGDIAFIIYAAAYALTGNGVSEVIDLTTTPTVAALSFTETLNDQTIAWFARCSTDNSVWGNWNAVIASGDGIPLGRYVQIKYVMGSVDGTVTPSLTDYTITYNTGYGTATSIKSDMSGDSTHFVDWDDRVWFTDGGTPQVWDGTEIMDVGFAPATAPMIGASGTGALTGEYKVKVTYVKDGVEGNPCVLCNTVTASADSQFDWTEIPTKTGYDRNLYRTSPDTDSYYCVATLIDETMTTYTDKVADALLGSTSYPAFDTDNNAPPSSSIIHSHKNYMFYVEAAAPSRVYVSEVNNPGHIPSAGYFQFPGAVLALKTYKNYLIASGENFLWYTAGDIFDVDPSIGDWSWKVVSSSTGCVAHESMIECLALEDNEMVIFPLTTGLKYLNANLLGTDLNSVPLSRNVQTYFDEAITRGTMAAILFDYAYYIAFNWSDPTSTAENHNNAVFKLDLRNMEWSGLWGMDISGFFVAENNLYMASSTCGRVYKYSGSDDDGKAIDMILDSRYAGDAYLRRKFPRIIVRLKRGSGTEDTTVLARCDDQEHTIELGECTEWKGSGGSERSVQDELVSPEFKTYLKKGNNFGFRFEDDSINDVVLYGITAITKRID
jgi:hypothetical protein